MGIASLPGTRLNARRVAALLGTLLAALATAAANAPAATLFGTVSTQEVGAASTPAAGASVTVLDQTQSTVAVASTGLDGTYTTTVPDGTYDVRFEPPPGGGFAASVVRDVDVATSRKLDIVLVPEGAARLSGAVAGVAGAVPWVPLALSSSSGGVLGASGADGSFAFGVTPGSYELSGRGFAEDGTGGLSLGLPDRWSFQTQSFDVSSDRAFDVDLPGTSVLTVRVVGSDGAPVAGAVVQLPMFDRAVAFGGVSASVQTPSFMDATDADGEVRVRVFDGSGPAFGRSGTVWPPAESGYGDVTFSPPTVDGDTTYVVRFTSPSGSDTTAPTIACDPPPTGWHADEVSVACVASDGGSGLADPADASFSLSTSVGDGNEDASAQTGTRQVCDRAGNCATAGPVGPIAVDRAAPSVAFSQQPTGGNGWWIATPGATHATATDLTIATLDCALDGVPQALVPTAGPGTLALDVSAAGEGRHAVSCTATDAVGHMAAGGDSVQIDATAPNAPRLQADRAPDYASRGSWYRDTVTVTVLGNGDPLLADGTAGSGVDPASTPAPATLATSGNHSVSGSVADLAGNGSLTTTAVFRVDADPPQTTLTCPAGTVARNAKATARWRDRDGESGLATAGTGSIALDTSRAGTYTVQHTATDNVGHGASSSCSYTVA